MDQIGCRRSPEVRLIRTSAAPGPWGTCPQRTCGAWSVPVLEVEDPQGASFITGPSVAHICERLCFIVQGPFSVAAGLLAERGWLVAGNPVFAYSSRHSSPRCELRSSLLEEQLAAAGRSPGDGTHGVP
jgi:hypothetical protein